MVWIGLFIILVIIGVISLLVSHFELHRLVVTEYAIASPKLNDVWDGYRIAMLGDLHENEFGEGNETLIQAIREAKPDAIVIVGDLIVAKEWKKKNFSVLDQLLKGISDIAPIYYANGNHEMRMELFPEQYPGWKEEFDEILKKYGIYSLIDETVWLKRRGEAIALSGLNIGNEYYRFKGKKRAMKPYYIEQKIGNAQKERFHILLAHTPLYIEEYANWGADLVLSGHFHGGTIRLPILGGVMTPQMQFFSGLDRGLVKKGRTRMIVTGGLGTHSINIRLNNPPELVMITLKSGEGTDSFQKGKTRKKKDR